VFVQGPVFGDGINGQLGMKVVFVRFIHPRQRRLAREAEKAVVGLARSAGRVTRREVAARLGLSAYQAAYILARLVRAGRLRRVGKGRGAQYEVAA
jgi:predicted transcriptional regulator of viral defense system